MSYGESATGSVKESVRTVRSTRAFERLFGALETVKKIGLIGTVGRACVCVIVHGERTPLSLAEIFDSISNTGVTESLVLLVGQLEGE